MSCSTAPDITGQHPESFTESVKDSARLSGLSEWSIRRLIYQGRIAAHRHGRRVLLQEALPSETATQAAVCRVGAVYPDDLREALLRRCACNLARRALPLGVLTGDAEAGSTMLPGRDPEVRRLEGPHRMVVFA